MLTFDLKELTLIYDFKNLLLRKMINNPVNKRKV